MAALVLAPRSFRLLFHLAATLTVAVALMPVDHQPPPFGYADKVQHFTIFLVLGLLARLGYPEAPARLVVERLAFLGAGIEVLQSIPLFDRDCDALDWLADIAGAALAMPLADGVARLLRRPGR